MLTCILQQSLLKLAAASHESLSTFQLFSAPAPAPAHAAMMTKSAAAPKPRLSYQLNEVELKIDSDLSERRDRLRSVL